MTKNFAHRGFSGKYPENTLLAFQKAIETGADGIENDVHLTKDGVAVIIHDEEVDRTTDGSGWVKDMTYEELSALNAAARYPEYGFQKIPTLAEYLELVAKTEMTINIELKTGLWEYPGIERKVYDLVREYGMLNRTIFSSFNHYSVRRMQEIDPGARTAMVLESWLIDAGSYVGGTGAAYIHPIFVSLNEESVAEMRAHGLAINTWTVNEEDDMRKMLRLGVDGIISNFPDRLEKVKKEWSNIQSQA